MLLLHLGLIVFASAVHSTAGLSSVYSRKDLEKWRPAVHGAIAVKVGEIPYQASIRLYGPGGNQHICSGAVLGRWHILTAARCITQSSPLMPESVYVVLGAVKRTALEDKDNSTIVRKVHRIARHPEYSSRTGAHDLAVLTLSSALPTDEIGVASVPLPAGAPILKSGTTCVVSGWGWGNNSTPGVGDDLLSAEVAYLNHDLCSEFYDPGRLVHDAVCSAHQKGGVGACLGSGGPLVCAGFLAGIVSWGQGCGFSALPTVYASLLTHVPWVLQELEAGTPPPPQRGLDRNRPLDNNSDAVTSGLNRTSSGILQEIILAVTIIRAALYGRQFLGT